MSDALAAIARIIEFGVGLVIVILTLDAAIRTFVLPRGTPVRITRMVARAVRAMFDAVSRPLTTYEARDRVMALYAPITLLMFMVVSLIGTGAGYVLMFHGVTDLDWRQSIRISGSALLTLGFAVPAGGAQVALVFTEAAIGLILIALLIAYIPTMYAAFSKRETLVSQLSVRAGTPPTAVDFLVRAQYAAFIEQLDPYFAQWEIWFDELDETHSSLAILSFFRSPNPHRSWITAAGVVLDAAALRLSVVDIPYTPQAAIVIRSGFVALRSVGSLYQIPFDPDPQPDDPISVAREEFDDALDRMAAAGVPIRADRDQAWRDFVGWRVNYDMLVIAISGLVMAPRAEWISDRSVIGWAPRRLRRRWSLRS